MGLSGPLRYDYFAKRVVDAETAWRLWSDGWALGDYAPRSIAPSALLKELLPRLRSEGIQAAVLPHSLGVRRRHLSRLALERPCRTPAEVLVT
jgi:hypothetical protein